MIRTFRTLLRGGVFAAFAAAALAQEAAAPAVPAGQPLTREELAAAVKNDAISVPSPGELMAALNKQGKPDWAGQIRPPITINSTSRAQMAFNIGGLIADGYIAVEAEDAQQVKNIGKDIMALAKPLGVQQEIINRGKSLTEFAERGQWETLKEEFEATQNEVKAAMIENKDQALVTLVTVGGWVRGTEVISDYLTKNYTESGAKLLRQPAIVQFLHQQVDSLPEKVRDDSAVKKVRNRLAQIQEAVSLPRDRAPSQESVQNLHALTIDLLKDLSRKDVK
jgi:hypothetical protein